MAGSKGGNPGQWSARKAQLLANRYRKAGGGYRGKKKKSQRSLSKWTREKWTTIDGKPAKQGGTMRRYLPAKAWQRLTPAQRRATNRKKILGSKKGKQFVANTSTARTVGKNVRGKK
jgi:UTP:GlnB (protein PII) uridylyltransferase